MSSAETKMSSPETSGDSNGEASPVETAGGSLTETNNIDKIREILFGTNMRDYEKRFDRLEERLLKESADLRDDARKRSDSLEAFVRSEFEALSERLRTEQGTRDESVQNLSRALQDANNSLERKLAQFDERNTQAQRELRQQILDQSKNLSEEIRQKTVELSALLDREVAELGNAKTDRASLASLFSEVALRLNNEFKIPGSD